MNKNALQQELLEIFKKYGVDVAVGLTKEGVAILSQESRVDARNIGYPEAYEAQPNE